MFLVNEAHYKCMIIGNWRFWLIDVDLFCSGKGKDHLVPVFFPKETWKAMHFLCNETNRKQAGVSQKNKYIFASTRGSDSHITGWHCMNDILESLGMKGRINPTGNRHRVASLMARFDLSESEKDLIYQHFGHSKNMNLDVYQACPGSLQLKTTGKLLKQIKVHEKGTEC